MKSIGFKEWALVCQALGRGEKCIILRKGGIAEGRRGFSFQHEQFCLFPTFFHEQLARVRSGSRSLPADDGVIKIEYCARVECALRIDSLQMVEALAPLHILSAEVVRERFHYETDGIDVAFVRIFALALPWSFPSEKRFGGCRSWVELPPPPTTHLTPVLSDKQHADRRCQFDEIVNGATG